MTLAQGSPSMVLFPICGCFGVVLLLVGLGAAIIWLSKRNTPSPTDGGDKRHVGGGWPRRVFLVTLALSVLYACFMLYFVESFPSHAWRNRTRSTTLAVADSKTGEPLPIDVTAWWAGSLEEDPFVVLEMGHNSPDEMKIRWNCGFRLTVMSEGYEKATVELTDTSPPRLIVPLTRVVPGTTTLSK